MSTQQSIAGNQGQWSHQQAHSRSLSGTASIFTNQFSDLTSNFSLKNNPISSTNFLSRANSITSQVSSVAGRIKDQISTTGKSKILLVIDDNQIDWSKYFRGKRICGDYDVRVEQCQFIDLSLYAHPDYGTICNITSQKRQFRPDFVFIREHVKKNQNDFTPIILGLRYGNVPSINSLLSVYNFIDRPLMYAELVNIQRKLGGKENFPLIEQTFYPSFKEMINNPPKFPCVMKVGFHHGGLGKLRADSLVHFQELLSILACLDTYLTVEPYIDAKCDIHIQKIGNNYKAFMRKSISGGWKSNIGSSVLEQIPVTDKYRLWADEVSKLFGGLDLVAIEIVETKSNEQYPEGQSYIYEVTGSQFTLMGETQEEDRRLMSDLITIKMQQAITIQSGGQVPKRGSITQLETDINNQFSPLRQEQSQHNSKSSGSNVFLQRMGSISGSIGSTLTSVTSNTSGTNKITNKFGSSSSISSPGNYAPTSTPSHLQQQVTDTVDKTAQQIRGLFRRASQATTDDQTQSQVEQGGDSEDTMKNLRKTFAGIFGEN